MTKVYQKHIHKFIYELSVTSRPLNYYDQLGSNQGHVILNAISP